MLVYPGIWLVHRLFHPELCLAWNLVGTRAVLSRSTRSHLAVYLWLQDCDNSNISLDSGLYCHEFRTVKNVTAPILRYLGRGIPNSGLSQP